MRSIQTITRQSVNMLENIHFRHIIRPHEISCFHRLDKIITKEIYMKKLALALSTIAFVAVAAPSFAEDTTPATETQAATATNDTAADANQPAETTKKKHKKHATKHKKHKEAAKQDSSAPADATNPADAASTPAN